MSTGQNTTKRAQFCRLLQQTHIKKMGANFYCFSVRPQAFKNKKRLKLEVITMETVERTVIFHLGMYLHKIKQT